MLIVSQLPSGHLSIKCDYYYRDRIRNIPTAYFNPTLKQWMIEPYMLGYLENEFKGELVYKTPRWVILNEPMPDMSEMYKISDTSIQCPALKLKPYDYQDYGVRFMIDKILQNNMVLNSDDVGLGKCHGKGTKILMYDGSIKNVEDIKVHDKLMGDDGTPRNVLSLAHGKEQMYKINLVNGDSYTCNESHILSLQVSAGNRYKHYRGGDIINISVKDYLKLPQWVKDKVLKSYKKPIDNFSLTNREFNIDPYMYGLWLGDGSSRRFDFTINNDDTEVIKYINQYAKTNNLHIRTVDEKGNCKTYCLSKGKNNSSSYQELNLVKASAYSGKHIHPDYKYASKDTRLQVLAGLLDTDGYLIDNVYEITTKFDQLKDDILFLARSLGFSVSNKKDKIINNKVYYRIFISGDTHLIPCKLPRKQASVRKQKKNPLIYGFTVEPLNVDDYYGFTLDGNHLYLLGDFTVTHNTIQTIGTLKWFIDNQGFTKILIICKKSIKRQWKEEIEKFTDLQKDFSLLYTGETAAKRKKAYKDFQNANKGVLITNYHSFLNDTEIIKMLNYDMVVIDEVHSVKARTGKLNNNIASAVQGKPVIFLTGTPVMSKPEDIFGIIQIANPDYFGPWKEFSKEHLVGAMTNFGYKIVGAKHLDELRDKVQNILIRRTRYEVSIDLPETNIVKISCDMDTVQEKLLKMIADETMELNDQMNRLKGPDGKIKDQQLYDKLDGRSKGLIAARQAASTDPRMFWYSNSKMMKEKYGAEVPKTYKMSSKAESIVDTVEDIIQSGNKVILFSKFVTSAKLVAQDIFNKLKFPVLMYTGLENQDTRDDNVNLFKQSVDHNILIGTDAMAEGLNLQVANCVINIDQPDTNAIKEQRIGRVRRAGSKFNNVTVYDMITANGIHAKSKDEERLENIEKNKDLSDALISIDEAQRQALIAAMKGE